MSNSSTPSSQPSIAVLTAGMQQITKTGAGQDTKVTDADCAAFVTAIGQCQTTLQGLPTQTVLNDYYPDGIGATNLPDAYDVRQQLMNTTDEFLLGMNGVHDWLGDLVNGVNAAISRFHAQDQST
jgi:hypothetical protein